MTQNRLLSSTVCMTLSLAAAHVGTQAHAQDQVQNIETVIVTGRAGVAEEIRKVEASYAITSISGESLRMNAPFGTADALKSVPGFWVESSGGEASANIRVRGIPKEGFSSIGMLEDGLPIQHDPGLGWLNADQSFRLDETIERIEVVRGGPASMFASNAPGGAVNFITRRPGAVPSGNLKLETTDYGLMRVDGWHGMPLDDWRLGIGGFYRVDDGVRDPGYRANEGGQLRVSLGRDFDGGSIDFNVKHIDDNVIFYTGLPLTRDASGDVVGVPGVDAGEGTLSGPETRRVTLRNADGPFELEPERGTELELTQLTARLEYRLPGAWLLRNGLRYRESESARIGLFPGTPVPAIDRLDQYRDSLIATVPGATDIQLRYASAPNSVFDVVNQNGNGLVVDGALREVSTPLDELVNDLRLLRDFDIGGQRHDIALGLYFARVDESFRRYSANSLVDVRDRARLLDVVAVDAAGNALATLTENGITRYGSEFANGTGKSTTWALYASDEWQVTEQLRIDLGARWENVSVDGRVERSAEVDLGGATIADDRVITGTGVFDQFDTDFDDFGWTIGANWQFHAGSGVFARYTATFRLPNVSSYIANATATPVIETMDFLEAGYKYANEGMSLYATVFNTRFDSLGFSELVFNPATGNFDSRTVYTDTETLGVELEGTVNAGELFDVTFSATWQDPEFGHLTNSRVVDGELLVDDYTGNRLVRVPSESYRITPAVNLLAQRLRFELDYQHYGKRYSDAANSLVLPKYDVVSANLRFAVTDSMTVYVRGENLLDEVGLTEGNPRAGQFQSGEAGSPFFVGRPIFGRNYRVSLLWSF